MITLIPASGWANTAPVIDAFTASPAVPVPGQVVRLTLRAHDPDCASTCTSGCGLYIRHDKLLWGDSTGRSPSPFANSVPSASASPWSATVDWTAPPADGTYTVTAEVKDSGGIACGGSLAKLATLSITVSSVPLPVIDSFEVTPSAVNVGDVAALTAVAHDPDGRPLSYEFTADAGTISHASPSTPNAQWTAPVNAGTVQIRCRVTVAGAPAVTAQQWVQVSIGGYTGALVLPGFSPTRAKAIRGDRIAVVDGVTGQLRVVTRAGTLVWTRTGLAEPVGIASLAGDLWVLERRARRVSRWSSAGTKKGTLAIEAALPIDLAASESLNELALVDATGSIQILDPSTGAVRRLVGQGILRTPTAATYAGAQLAIADPGNNRIHVFDQQGALQVTLGDDTLLVRPQSVARDETDGTWIAGDSFSGELQIIDASGTLRGTLAGFGDAEGKLTNPIDVSFLSESREIVASTLSQGMRFYSLYSTLPRPDAAVGVTAADRLGDDGGAIEVRWTPSPDDPARVTGYYVERDGGGDGDYTRLGLVPAGSVTYLDTAASTGGCHVYRIVATTGVTERPSAPTGCVSSVNDLAPGIPAALTASALTPRAIEMQWAPVPVADLAGYLLSIQWTGGSRALTTSPWISSTKLTDLAPGTDYVVTLRAVDTAGNQSGVRQTVVTTWPDEAPPAATAVAVEDTKDGGVLRVSWTMPQGRVPVAYYAVDLIPQQAGWPARKLTTASTEERVRGLVNELGYVATITPYTPWDRPGETRSSTVVMPSAPVRDLPLLRRAGREGTLGIEDSAGVAMRVPFSQETRTVKFLYRALGTPVAVLWNGRMLGDLLADTAGAWVEAERLLERGDAAEGRLDVRNYSFPSATAEVAVNRVDLVPLPPVSPSANSFDTVIDVQWGWPERRSDLVVRVIGTDSPSRRRVVAPANPTREWEDLACQLPASGVCRDPFLEPGTGRKYGIAIESPAGWLSEAGWVHGRTGPADGPPPVTDLLVTTIGENLRLRWTPISFYSRRTGTIEPVGQYRVYRTDGVVTVLLTEAPGPPLSLAPDALRPDREWFIVHSVDDEGRESK